MTKMIFSAFGADRPGMVSALTQVLFDLGCNMEDTRMTQLEDHFAMLIIAHTPDALDNAALARQCDSIRTTLGLEITWHPIETASEQSNNTGTPWMISVSGLDQGGIIFHVSQYLAKRQINIRQLSSKRLSRPSGETLFLMAIEVDVPTQLPEITVQTELAGLAQAAQLEIHAEPLEVYTL